MKQDVDTESLQKTGLILAIFQLLHTALTCRKEAAIPNYSVKKKCVPLMCFALLKEAIYVESIVSVWSRQSWNAWVYIKDYCENMTRHEIWPKRFISAIQKLKARLSEQRKRLCNGFFWGFILQLQNACALHPSLETITSAVQHSMVYIFSSYCFLCSILFQPRGGRNIHACFEDHKNMIRRLNSAQNYWWESQHMALTELSRSQTFEKIF